MESVLITIAESPPLFTGHQASPTRYNLSHTNNTKVIPILVSRRRFVTVPATVPAKEAGNGQDQVQVMRQTTIAPVSGVAKNGTGAALAPTPTAPHAGPGSSKPEA